MLGLFLEFSQAFLQRFVLFRFAFEFLNLGEELLLLRFDLFKLRLLLFRQVATFFLSLSFLRKIGPQNRQGMTELLSVLDHFFIFRIGQLPIDFQLLFGFARVGDAFEEVVALGCESGFSGLQILRHQMNRFPKRFVLRFLRIESLVRASVLDHRGGRFLGIVQQGLAVRFLPSLFLLRSCFGGCA